MYDSNGNVKPTRLSALLNAALGYVADQTQGFIDFDAVPEEGASIQVCLLCYASPPCFACSRMMWMTSYLTVCLMLTVTPHCTDFISKPFVDLWLSSGLDLVLTF